MCRSKKPLIKGVAFAVLAALCWGTNFIVPYVKGDYSLMAFMGVRFAAVGLTGIVWLVLNLHALGLLEWPERLMGLALGAIGYFGYAICIAYGVAMSGPVLTPALIATVPVLLALLGNAKTKSVRWRVLAVPLLVLLSGLLLINVGAGKKTAGDADNLSAGGVFAAGAVALWLIFSVSNQRWIGKLPHRSMGVWTALMMIGSALGMTLMFTAGYVSGLFSAPANILAVYDAPGVYVWAIVIALLSSVVGAWAWNAAARVLPMVLSGQLIALEPLFATAMSLMFEKRLPMLHEALGMGVTLAGTLLAIKVVSARQSKHP
ncbi:DMT family transporter [Pseudomonas sp. CDFA 602]|uniref:DMT family transporter n=1 Tax=Pseudomonas californiensis TaxID=2829823 RepID=UPI001E4FB645|nr:DMT family transporter [Pseudomonas californiensis]MCD5994842.1 DMT family transporter [Pseudomonas californiensis]MCD6000527.1 DMT family transporter [Pseudomonas californiensis]